MILVDTSAWIDWLRGDATQAVTGLEHVMAAGVPFGITGIIFQEILQGAGSPASFQRLEEYFASQRFHQPMDPVQSHAAAAAIYADCRRAGITIRSTIDCLIARIAIEHELLLLHSDRDFPRMHPVAPALRLFEDEYPV